MGRRALSERERDLNRKKRNQKYSSKLDSKTKKQEYNRKRKQSTSRGTNIHLCADRLIDRIDLLIQETSEPIVENGEVLVMDTTYNDGYDEGESTSLGAHDLAFGCDDDERMNLFKWQRLIIRAINDENERGRRWSWDTYYTIHRSND
jgi:hypothetical protein